MVGGAEWCAARWVLCAAGLSGTDLRRTWSPVEGFPADEPCDEVLGSATAAPEIDGWRTIGGAPEDPCPEEDEEEEEELPIGGADVGAVTDEPDDEDERACGAGSGAGPLPDDGAACGVGAGFGDACAMPGSARAVATTTGPITPTHRVKINATVARAIRVSEPPRRVRRFSRARTSPSQL